LKDKFSHLHMTDISFSSDSDGENVFHNEEHKNHPEKILFKEKLSKFSESLLKSLKRQLMPKRHSRKSKRGSELKATTCKRSKSAPLFRASPKPFDRDYSQSQLLNTLPQKPNNALENTFSLQQAIKFEKAKEEFEPIQKSIKYENVAFLSAAQAIKVIEKADDFDPLFQGIFH